MRTEDGWNFLPPHLLNRLNGFGFMPGKEIKAAGVGNLGLQDRKYILLWLSKYLSGILQRGLDFNGSRSTSQHLVEIPKK